MAQGELEGAGLHLPLEVDGQEFQPLCTGLNCGIPSSLKKRIACNELCRGRRLPEGFLQCQRLK